MAAQEADALNENHRRHFLSSCQYVDRLLTEMEAILASSESGSPFNRFVSDVPPARKRVVLDFIARIRRELVRALESEGLQPDAPSTRAAHALRTHLSFILDVIRALHDVIERQGADVGIRRTQRANRHRLDSSCFLARGKRFWDTALFDEQTRVRSLCGRRRGKCGKSRGMR